MSRVQLYGLSGVPRYAPTRVRYVRVIFDLGLVVGGYFFRANTGSTGGTLTGTVASFKDDVFTQMASGPGGVTNTVTMYKGSVVAGGQWLGSLSRWNGLSWDLVKSSGGTGIDNICYSAVQYGEDLIACGRFDSADGLAVNNIARWDGEQWNAMGAGIVHTTSTNVSVRAMIVYGDNLYACGNFNKAGTVDAQNLARWNGSSWSKVGDSVLNGPTKCMCIWNNKLVVGGTFPTAATSVANARGLATWNGSTWARVSPETYLNHGDINAVASYKGSLIIAGNGCGGTGFGNIARWNGSEWVKLGTGLNGIVNCLAVSGNFLIAGGSFTQAGGNTAYRIAKWNGSSWSPVGLGVNSDVLTILPTE